MCGLLYVVCCMLIFGGFGCLLFVGGCVLRAGCCVLIVCLWFVACCAVF